MGVTAVLGADQVKSFTRSLVQTARAADEWSALWCDPLTGDRWQELSLQSGMHGSGYRVLIRDPEPSSSEWIEILKQSADNDEVVVAALRLAETPAAFRPLLAALAELSLRGDHQRVVVAIQWSGLASPLNRQNPIGKHVREVERDALEWEQIATSAQELLAAASRHSGK